MSISSILNEVIRTIYLFIYFYEDILHTKKSYKAPKQRLLRYSYTPKSIIKHTDDYHLDVTPKSIKKSKQRLLRYFYTLKKDAKK